MKMNAVKCHLFISGNKFEQMWVRVRDDMIWESTTVKLLRITIANELKFDEHLTDICIKANRKLTVLTRMRKYLISIRWDFCLSYFLNPSPNIVPSRGCFIVEKLITGLINFMSGLLG